VRVQNPNQRLASLPLSGRRFDAAAFRRSPRAARAGAHPRRVGFGLGALSLERAHAIERSSSGIGRPLEITRSNPRTPPSRARAESMHSRPFQSPSRSRGESAARSGRSAHGDSSPKSAEWALHDGAQASDWPPLRPTAEDARCRSSARC